jgi:tRNA-specific 2-thiouridylase
VKFDRLLGRLSDFDCDVLVTGHHARSVEGNGTWRLQRGEDAAKDQSYVLSMLTQAELSRTRFPVGEMTKRQVRAVAGGMGLRTAAKPESMDICFVGQRDYRGFLRDVAPEVFTPGMVVDTDGNVLSEHDGIAEFTVGQRRGLGVAVGEPRFVVDIEPATSTVMIGGLHDLEVSGVTLEQVTWTAGVPTGSEVMAQFRAHGEPVAATLTGSTLSFAEPQRALAPGQTVAFYDGDVVLGGALIAGTLH